jgi:hypothetical protein
MTFYFQYSRQEEINQLWAKNSAKLEEEPYDILAKDIFICSCFLECFGEKFNKTLFEILVKRYENEKKNNLNILAYMTGALQNFSAAGHGSVDLLKAREALSNSSWQSDMDRDLLAELVFSDVMGGGASNIEAYRKIIDDCKELDRFSTYEFLVSTFFISINRGEAGLENQIIEYLNKLMEKFEISGKLYANYSGEIKKGSGRYDMLYNYFFLSAILLMENTKNENYRYFNAILKLNDLFSDYIKKVEKDDLLFILTPLFVMEEKAILYLYDSKQFRLPVNQ